MKKTSSGHRLQSHKFNNHLNNRVNQNNSNKWISKVLILVLKYLKHSSRYKAYKIILNIYLSPPVNLELCRRLKTYSLKLSRWVTLELNLNICKDISPKRWLRTNSWCKMVKFQTVRLLLIAKCIINQQYFSLKPLRNGNVLSVC